ncbi:MAG TPA: tetratricopeptide repeat protein [Candidatus Solibacter sp.]|nr:tetratricopeptide repeat protein [Candidatus Solibacter sp.]
MKAPNLFTAAMIAAASLCAQPPQGGRGGPQSESLRAATQAVREGKNAEALAAVKKELEANPNSSQAASMLDNLGATGDARKVFQRMIDGASDPRAKANAQRAMAMSYAFDGDCKNTAKYEQMVIDYWKTQEQAEPQNAFYQEGEMANEAARVCIDAGDLETAEQLYRKGTELGLKEPEPKRNPASLWNFRLEHALGRLAARRGNKAEAAKHVAAARKLLDGDSTMAGQQERFYPYLTGYVALYTGDFKTAETELTKAVQANGNDAFMMCLLGMTYERMGDKDKSNEWYKKAAAAVPPGGHNPPAAFARPFTRKKLAQ